MALPPWLNRFLKWFAKETFGNWLYDLLSVLWKSAVMTIILTIWIRLASIPPDIKLVIGLFIVALVFLSLQLFIDKQHKESQPISKIGETETANTENEAEKRIEALNAQHQSVKDELERQIERFQENENTLQLSIKARDDELKQWAWLRQIAENDKRNISSYVYLIFRKVRYEGLNAELQKYIEIYFDIINASVYSVTIDKTIQGGAVYLNNEELNPNSTTIDGSLFHISRDERSDRRFLVIKLRLTPTEVERIRNPLPEDKLHFDRLWLNVKAENTDSDEQPRRLCFPSEIPIVPVPQPHPVTTRN